MKNTKQLVLFLFFVGSSFFSFSQQFTGQLFDEATGKAVIGAVVSIANSDVQAISNATGTYRLFDMEPGEYQVFIKAGGYEMWTGNISLDGESGTITEVKMMASQNNRNTDGGVDINVISEAQLDQVEDESQVSSLLTAGRDPFNNAAAFNLGAARFRIRGLAQEYNGTYLNGMPFNDLDDGRAFWTIWGGLNDVLRVREAVEGVRVSNFAFSGVNGATNIDMRPSVQRKQLKAVYNFANFAYSHRAMLTYSTGLNENGWAFTFSGSRRWAQEGYIEGTFYDAFSYFGAAEKRFNSHHGLSVNIFGAPSKRGRSSASTQEMYDLTGNPFYNPNWGYLNGEKRNPRQFRVHLPVGMLRHDYTPSNKLKVTTSVAYMTGKNASTGIDWFEAADPRPDYYRKLPSFQDNILLANLVEEELKSDQANQQVDLESMYAINANRFSIIENANGIAGNTVEGKLAAYILQEEHFDTDKFVFASTMNSIINASVNFNAGVQYINDKNEFFRQVDDLMGADFSVNWDQFAPEEGSSSSIVDTLKQNDLEVPNKILYEGDIYGHHYFIKNQKISTWATGEFTFSKFDFFVGGQINQLSYQREGIFRNGAFPDDSFGDGPVNSFLTGMVKTGATYKINGRNYLYANAAYGTDAPGSRNSYVSPRTRHALIEGLDNEKIYSAEAGYNARFPKFKARLTAYINQINDQFETRNVYVDNTRQFGNVITKNIDQRFLGVEYGSEFNITSTINGSLAIAYGEHFYTDRPNLEFAIDDTEIVTDLGPVYIKNYRVASGPQTAATAGLEYRSPKFWSISVNANYFDHNYLNVSPFRRFGGIADDPIVAYSNVVSDLEKTEASSEQLLKAEQLFDELGISLDQVFEQERFDPALTIDLYTRKSWKVNDKYIVLSASVNNILNNVFRSGGYEQLRTRFLLRDRNEDGQYSLDNLFPPKYFNAYGRSYFLTASISLN